MPATMHSKTTARRYNALIRQTKSGKRRSFAIGQLGPKGILLVSARKPTVAGPMLKAIPYPKTDATKVPLPAGAKPQLLAAGEIVLDGQDVILKCIRLQASPAQLKTHFIGYFKAFGTAPVSTKIITYRPSDWDSVEFEEDADAETVESTEVVDESEVDEPPLETSGPDAIVAEPDEVVDGVKADAPSPESIGLDPTEAQPSEDVEALSQPETPPVSGSPDLLDTDQPNSAEATPAADVSQNGPDDLPPGPEPGDDEATAKVKEQARRLLALAMESAAHLGISAGAADSKIWDILKPILAMPPERQAEMLEVLRVKLTLAIASPEKLAAVLGANSGGGKNDGGRTRERPRGSKIAYAQLLLDWDDARKQAGADLQKLEAAILDEFQDQPDLSEVRTNVRKLYTILATFGSGLQDKLDMAMKAREEDRPALHQEALALIGQYRSYVDGDEFVSAVEHNPFTSISVQKTLSETLGRLAKTLAA